MKNTRQDRRQFLTASAAAAAGLILGQQQASRAAPQARIRIEAPFHGAVLNHRHGSTVEGGLVIRVGGEAPAGTRVTVQGQAAKREGDRFIAEVTLREKETDIEAVSEGGGQRSQAQVRVVWDRHSQPRYRFAIDDNSFFLRDIFQKKYKSLFDCSYLAMLRDLNAKYGAKFVLNIYYTTDDGFDLTRFPDRYRSQWKDNAHWLRLAFHARANDPGRPYQEAPVERLLADLEQVNEQIHRFAGPETFSPPTVIHFAMIRPEAFKPLYQKGVRVLSGLFRRSGTKWDINYELDDERSEWISRHDAWKDFASSIVFSMIDIVCNSTPLEKTVPTLEKVVADANRAEILDLFTHEQYFWPFYKNYLPDHPQRLDAAIRFVTERGYKPVLFHEGFLGGPE